MGGIAVFIVWIVIIVVFTSIGKKKQGAAAPNKAPQKTSSAAPVKNTSGYDRRASQSTVRSSQGAFQNAVQSSQNTKRNAAGYGRGTAGNRQSMTKYSQMGPKNDRGTGKKKQTAYQQNDGIYRQDALNPKDDILARANSNIKQQFSENVLEQEQNVILKSGAGHQQMPVGENMDLMKEVFDLMIIGPDTSTYYGRDFVAEGIEMVNRSLESF